MAGLEKRVVLRVAIKFSDEVAIELLKDLNPHVLGSDELAVWPGIGIAILKDELHDIAGACGESFLV